MRRYPKVTFDKDIAFKNADAEFVSFGHPLFEAIMSCVEKIFPYSLSNGSLFLDPDCRLDGYILYYEGEIRDGTGAVAGKRLFAFYTDGTEIKPISPAVIWDIAEGSGLADGAWDIELIKKLVSSKVISKLEGYKNEISKERAHQSDIKEKYGIRSFQKNQRLGGQWHFRLIGVTAVIKSHADEFGWSARYQQLHLAQLVIVVGCLETAKWTAGENLDQFLLQ